MSDLDIDMNDEWVQMYARLPHYEKRGSKWYYIHYGGEIMSEVSKDKSEKLDREQQMWADKWEELGKELERINNRYE